MPTPLVDKTQKERRELIEVLDVLDRWDDRLQGHQTQKRDHERSPFRTMMVIIAATDEEESVQSYDISSGVEVWSRNISQGGISFLCRGQLDWKRICLCLDPDQNHEQWYHAEIVRSRLVYNDFWEYGAQFIGRVKV